MRRSAQLASSALFQVFNEHMSQQDRVDQSYKRALAVGKLYNLSAEDVLSTSAKYWELHTDPITLLDGSVGTLLTIHYNLCCGTFAQFAEGRSDIQKTLERLLAFESFGNFCLTEVGHGLDAINLETTAVLQSDGSFVLNTPNERAAKFMPPTTPAGIPSIAVVFARLIIGNEDRGVKPFCVALHDGHMMSKGVVSKRVDHSSDDWPLTTFSRLLSPRGAARPVAHALTYFHHVSIPPNALMSNLNKATDPHADFFSNIARVIVGTMSMGAFGLAAMQLASHIAIRYSQLRTVIDASTRSPRPIISFSTQYTPLLTVLAQTFVMEAFLKKCISMFTDPGARPKLKHCIAAISKVVLMQLSHNATLALSDRCGAQGLFEVNQLSVMHADMRGAAIAEGDTLVLSIKFATELLIGRVVLPASPYPDSPLACYEHSLFLDLQQQTSTMSHHRNPAFEEIILPQCQPLIQAIGHRIAHDAAIEAGIDQNIITLYVASIVKFDSAWYCEHAVLSTSDQRELERKALAALLPRLDSLLAKLDVEAYCTAPMISDERWARYVRSLPTYGKAEVCSPRKLGNGGDIMGRAGLFLKALL